MLPRHVTTTVVLAAALAVALAVAPAPARAAGDRTGTRSDLAKTRAQIRDLEAARRADARERARLAARLKVAEQAAARVREPLRELRREIVAAREAERAAGRAIAAEEAALARQRAALAAQVRRAWVGGPATPLRLVLSPGEPAAAGRRLTWIAYVAREQQALLGEIDATLARLAEQQAAAAARARELEDLAERERARLAELDAARKDRKAVLASLDATAATRDSRLRKLREEAAALERVLRELDRQARASARRAPTPDPAPGKALPPGRWPVDGKLLADYGQARAGGQLRWDGVLIAAPAGTDVRAARDGTVVYADWLPGLGLLLVLDHGRGYLSLYGHNQDLLKTVGSKVGRGETIAQVGDTGGQSQPALYFEVRRNGRPQNPRQWVK
jgi:septal ring factor EnvC (AmiA/AmiB activator)